MLNLLQKWNLLTLKSRMTEMSTSSLNSFKNIKLKTSLERISHSYSRHSIIFPQCWKLQEIPHSSVPQVISITNSPAQKQRRVSARILQEADGYHYKFSASITKILQFYFFSMKTLTRAKQGTYRSFFMTQTNWIVFACSRQFFGSQGRDKKMK